MGIILKEHTVNGNRGSGTVRALYDAGSGASFIRRDVAERLGDFNPMPSPYEFTMADGRGTITVSETINLDFPFGDARIYYFFFVVDELAKEMIIGADMMQRWKMKLDFDNDDIDIDPIALQLTI